MRIKHFLFFTLNLVSTVLTAGSFTSDSTDDYYNADFMRYDNHIYKKEIKTVRLYKTGLELTTPVLDLGSPDKLTLSFDDLQADVKDYHYTFIHCDASWQPSDLLSSQFINGFTDDRITDYKFSFNTIQHYTHYNLIFPTADMQPTISGNYLLKVYNGNNPDDLILSRRFMIVDPKVDVTASIHRATIVTDRDTKQEIDFKVLHPNYSIDNVFDGFHVIITQNDRWDNSISNLKPLFVKEGELDYDYDQGNVFKGGNEFRNFDIRTIKFQTERIANITFDTINKVYIQPDKDLSFDRYSIISDINGKYTIVYRDGDNSDIEADYVQVFFKLPYQMPLSGGNLYIFGQLTDWVINNDCKLKYDYTDMSYKGSLFLKQGYYNYQYVYASDAKKSADETLVEGNHFETENNYTIYIYNRPQGSRYDQLIGIKTFNTKNIY